MALNEKPYSLSEDEFNTLQRAQESIQLISILLDEVPRPCAFTLGMLASFMTVGEEVVGGELVGGTVLPR